jgi:integrase
MELKKERLTGLARIAAQSGGLPDVRERLYEQLSKEIREITRQVAELDDLRKPRAVGSDRDMIAHLKHRNMVLETILANLDDKANAIAREYADFFAQAGSERGRLEDRMTDYEADLRTEAVDAYKARGESEKARGEYEKAKIESQTLEKRIVDGDEDKNAALRAMQFAFDETQRLQQDNRTLLNKLDYKGPLLSEVKYKFIDNMKSRSVSKKLIADVSIKIDLFMNLIGDKNIGNYVFSDMQRFASRLSHLPQKHSISPRWRKKTAVQVIEEHEEKRPPHVEYLTENTIINNFVGRVKTAIRWLAAESGIDNPFREKIRIVAPAARSSVIRHGFTIEQVNSLIEHAAFARKADEAWLPLVALLTGARIGELIMTCPDEIEQRNGIWVMDMTRQGRDHRASPRSLKTETSRRYVVLHQKLIELGFHRWATDSKREWVFEDFHGAAAPANAASKRFQRLFKLWGLTGRNTEVFHALRHTYKDLARAAGADERTIALQTGHSLDGVAMNYGSKVLRPDEMKKLSGIELPTEWNLSAYESLVRRIAANDPSSRYRKRRRRAVIEE